MLELDPELRRNLIPAGYMAKRVAAKPTWLKADHVADIYSLSACISKNFADYIPFWRHNGFWLFDDPSIIRELAVQHGIDLGDCTMFYYEAYAKQYDGALRQWRDYDPQRDFPLKVSASDSNTLQGFDIVTFYCQTSAECSPLSCNHVAETISTNEHCLLNSLDEALDHLEKGDFSNSEPGPYRIFAVYTA